MFQERVILSAYDYDQIENPQNGVRCTARELCAPIANSRDLLDNIQNDIWKNGRVGFFSDTKKICKNSFICMCVYNRTCEVLVSYYCS